MGVWGSANFQNDHAADYLASDIALPLKKKLQRLIAEPSLAEPDRRESAQIMAALEVLALLSEEMKVVPPMPEIVAEGREVFLRVWDGYIDRLKPSPKFKRERRNVIVASFDRLLRVARAYHEAPN